VVVDRLFAEPRLAELYDLWHPWDQRGDFGFYLPLVLAAGSVLDIGCGTGQLLRLARQAGHAGRLCGLDPADGMLRQARARPDIEWVLGRAESARWDQEFDLAVMTGHAFQVLVEDEEIRASLAAIRTALVPGGRFAFETRNPAARAWERWVPDNAVEVIGPAGAVVRKADQVRRPADGRKVSFTTTFTSPAWDRPEVSHSTLRFLGAGELSAFLADAGLVVEEQHGDWGRQPLSEVSPEIITIAQRG
jgi:SAM-dependent methyltransferase